MTGNSPSTDRPAQDVPLCGWCYVPRHSHDPSTISPHALFVVRAVEALRIANRESERGTPAAAQAADGSSSTRRGAGASRSWSATGSSGLASRRLKRAKSVSTWAAVRSQRGMATGKTSDSSKSLNEVGVSIGMVDRTPADCDKGWMGMHVWSMVDNICLNCGVMR